MKIAYLHIKFAKLLCIYNHNHLHATKSIFNHKADQQNLHMAISLIASCATGFNIAWATRCNAAHLQWCVPEVL